jgi:hypothetical protein
MFAMGGKPSKSIVKLLLMTMCVNLPLEHRIPSQIGFLCIQDFASTTGAVFHVSIKLLSFP